MGCCACEEDREKDNKFADLSSPVGERGCTDIVCLIIFIVFWIGMIFISAFSFTYGDGERLVFGYDSFGNTCGKRNDPIKNVSNSGMDMRKRTHVFFMNIENPAKSMAICVKECPDVKMSNQREYQEYAKRTGIHLCRYEVDPADYNITVSGTRGPCPKVVYKSISLLNRCVPSNLKDIPKDIAKKIVAYLNDTDIFEKILGDLYRCWREIVFLCLIALCMSFILLLLMRFLAGIIVYLILIIVSLGSIIGTAFLWWTYSSFKTKLDHDEAFQIPFLDVEINGENAFLAYSIIATILTVILLLVIFVMRKRISLAVSLFKEAGKCVVDIPLLLIQPFWTILALGAFFAYWVVALAYLSTAENPASTPEGFVVYKDHILVSWFWWYHVIGLIWTAEFIIACEQLVISEIVTTWFFTRDKSSLSCTVPKAVCHVMTYHLGTAAFGSLIITLVKLPRMILMYIDKKLKASENEFARFCIKCCSCCLWCLECCLKFLNANAYTVVAIKGTDFCPSARRAFNILVNNALRVAAINSVGDFLLFLAKLGIMASTGAIAVVWLKSLSDLHYYAIPVLLTCVFSYLLASCFMSQYEIVIDALLLSFCEDVEMNDGSAEKPYYMDSSLMEFVDNSTKKLNSLKKEENTNTDEAASSMQ